MQDKELFNLSNNDQHDFNNINCSISAWLTVIFCCLFWNVADSLQLPHSSLQLCNNSTGTSDASCAVSAAPIQQHHQLSSFKRLLQEDSSPDYEESVLHPYAVLSRIGRVSRPDGC
jgi:hypothetical protein